MTKAEILNIVTEAKKLSYIDTEEAYNRWSELIDVIENGCYDVGQDNKLWQEVTNDIGVTW